MRVHPTFFDLATPWTSAKMRVASERVLTQYKAAAAAAAASAAVGVLAMER